MNDLQFAVRTLRKSPGFTVTAVLTLALGIGANTAIFSLVHAVILKPLPFREPARLIVIWDSYRPQFEKIGISPAELNIWQQQSDLFSESAWYRSVPQNLPLTGAGGEAVEVHADLVSARLFPLLGAAPALGRAFTESDAPNTVVLSEHLWRTRFAGDPEIAGKSIRMNGEAFAVTGVMPHDFAFPDWADLWIPKGPLMGDELSNSVRHALGFVGRLRDGVALNGVTQRIGGLSRRLAAENPKTSHGWGMNAYGLQEDLTAKLRPALLMLLGAVTLVLLIACTNVANLLLSRAASRTKEMALRTALGAGAGRLIRQLLAESLLLSAMGGGLGLLIAKLSVARFSPVPAPLDSAVLWFLLAISLATAALFGLIPAMQAFAADPVTAIKSASVSSGGSRRIRGALVVAEFAFALILAAGAGTLVQSFVRLMHVDPGFDPHGVLSLRLSIPPSRDAAALFRRIDERLRTLPGVESVAASNMLPLAADRAYTSRFNVPGSPLIDPNALPAAQLRSVTPDYFRAMRIPLRSGRVFTPKDYNAPVVIVNETMARRFWPGRDPVGIQFVTGPWGPNPQWSTIVGVAGDVKQFGLDSEPTLDMYFASPAASYVVVRAAGNLTALALVARREIRGIDGEVPVSDVSTMDEVLDESARSRRWTMALLAAFAGLALALAAVGIYGVMAWMVGQRTREIGIRMALGANAREVRGMVVGYALKLSSMGMAVGIAGAFALRRVMASLVFEAGSSGPATIAAVAALMLAVAAVASYVPARRASRVDPSIALRWE
ncbi:MAG: ABC transporter permease [Bryobacteraceae bacterium]|jgi:putative ABC transport system permease protein